MIKVIAKSGIYGIISRVIFSLSQVVLIPFLLMLYGKEDFGVLITLISLNGFLALCNFGISKSMQNKVTRSLSEAGVTGNTACNLLCASFRFVFFRAGVIFLILFFVYSYIDVVKGYNRIYLVLFFLIGGFSLLLLNIILDYYRGVARPDSANKITMTLNLLTVFSSVLCLIVKVDLEVYYLIVYVIPPTIFLTFLFNKLNIIKLAEVSKNIIVFDNKSKQFLMLTIIQFFGFGFDTFVISTVLGAEVAAEYGVLFRFYSFILFSFTVFSSSLWPFITKLHSEKKTKEMLLLIKRMFYTSVLFAFLSFFILYKGVPLVIERFIKSLDFQSEGLFLAMSIQLVVVILTSMLIPILNSLELLKTQIYSGILNVVTNLFLTITFIKIYGVIAAPYATAFSNFIFGVIPLAFILFKALKSYDKEFN